MLLNKNNYNLIKCTFQNIKKKGRKTGKVIFHEHSRSKYLEC